MYTYNNQWLKKWLTKKVWPWCENTAYITGYKIVTVNVGNSWITRWMCAELQMGLTSKCYTKIIKCPLILSLQLFCVYHFNWDLNVKCQNCFKHIFGGVLAAPVLWTLVCWQRQCSSSASVLNTGVLPAPVFWTLTILSYNSTEGEGGCSVVSTTEG